MKTVYRISKDKELNVTSPFDNWGEKGVAKEFIFFHGDLPTDYYWRTSGTFSTFNSEQEVMEILKVLPTGNYQIEKYYVI